MSIVKRDPCPLFSLVNNYPITFLKFKNITKANQNDLLNEFPELYNPAFDRDLALKLYERVSSQSFEVFKKYPHVLKIIG